VAARRTRQQSLNPEEVDPADSENAGTALYAAYQTKLYSAPPVVNGLIPKNAYGNLDIYVPSMVPPGGTHINHPETAKAAKIIGIDYADAITGFSFKGRHGTAITKGAVIASEYREAIEEVIRTFENDRARVEEERRSLEALRMWKRLLAGLRIRERIEGYDIEGERDVAMKEELEKVEQEGEDGIGDDEGGGFLPDRENDFDAQPTVGRKLEARSLASLVEDAGGGFMAEDTEDQNVQSNAVPPRPRDPFLNNIDEDDGGGFLVNDDDADAEEALRDTTFNPDPNFNPTGNATVRKPEDVRDPDVIIEHESAEPRDDGSKASDANQSEDAVLETAHGMVDEMANEMAEEQTTEVVNDQVEDTAPYPISYDLLPEDLEEARMLQQLHETNTMSQHPSSPSHQSSPNTADRPRPPDGQAHLIEQSTRAEAADLEHPSPVSPRNDLVEEDSIEAESSESDKGSLLSRDPEDEDAEPEWLV